MRVRLLAILLVAAAWLGGAAGLGPLHGGGRLAGPAVAIAASPEPTPVTGGDPRSAGEGPGFVGAPLFAILAVIALGVGTAVLTILYVRLTGGPARRAGPPR